MKPSEFKQGKSPKELGKKITAISIDLTEDCSLRCTYCFCDQSPSGQVSKSKNVLSLQAGKEIIDWALSDDVSDKELHIEWWGGEPFIQFELMKELTIYAKQKANELGKQISFGGTTNIVSLTEEKVQWIIDETKGFLLSCDGRGERNKERIFPDGSNSWSALEMKLEMVKEVYSKNNKPLPSIRMTASSSTVEGMADDMIYFHEQGWSHVFSSENYDCTWTPEQFKQFEVECRKLSDYRFDCLKDNKKFMASKFFDDMAMHVIEPRKMKEDEPAWSCGAGKGYMGISVEGAIYACHRNNKHNTLDKEWHDKDRCLGSIYEGITNLELYDKINKTLIPDKCKGCPVETSCLGGCIAVCKDLTNDEFGSVDNICKTKMIMYNVVLNEINQVMKLGKFQDYLKLVNTRKNRNKDHKPVSCACHSTTYTNSVKIFAEVGKDKDDVTNLLIYVSKIIDQELAKKIKNNIPHCLCNTQQYNDNNLHKQFNISEVQKKDIINTFASMFGGETNG